MAIVSTTVEYWAVLLWFIRGKPLGECPYLVGDENRQARVQLRALSLVTDDPLPFSTCSVLQEGT